MTTPQVDVLKTYIDRAPLAAPSNPNLLGYTGYGWKACPSCIARILARGCSIPPHIKVWKEGNNEPFECDLKEFHQK